LEVLNRALMRINAGSARRGRLQAVEVENVVQPDERSLLTRAGLDALIGALAGRGYRVVGPKLRDQAIIYDDIAGVGDLPAGWTDEQDGGHYRLERRDDDALFGYAVGPHSWKKYLLPPRLQLWSAKRGETGFSIKSEPEATPPFAFVGVRACEIQAIAIQDRVFLEGPHVDPHYQARRADAFIVAVNCGKAGGTCFCVSMDTGPCAKSGFDIALTELIGDGEPTYVVETGSAIGVEVMSELHSRAAQPTEIAAAEAVSARTAATMGRSMETEGIRDLLMNNLDHPRWDDAAERCLTCGNCTMVCPTCFCTSVEDASDLSGEEASRSRRWDSCFTMDFSFIHGGSVRASPKSRYRQWMTHKLATWIDQFDTSGCVGCGRCITWCPVGIDITEEARAIRDEPGQEAKQ
jgi:sulfhydrogenase subunit beta (sulfur reductase)